MRDRPPLHHAKGRRQALDAQWLGYLAEGGDPGQGDSLLSAPGFVEGIRSFNEGDYFEAHERFELAWRASDYPERMLPHALSKLSAAYHHGNRGRTQAAAKLGESSNAVLAILPPFFATIDINALRAGVTLWLNSGSTAMAHIHRVG